ncbi:ABC transporter C family member 10-like [Olea europaea subsp. europaea]|uniref:ABC-type xenobiotic transporter n=1 Tax=Olea europaea subsp. europaea TaxID=158383 RepID=A0A8S0SUB8_OLEEU|nr:ABC transporter C family member 10-like [Olea europaea subsp. europaea]
MFMIHGLIWLLVGLSVSLMGWHFPRTLLRTLSTLAFLFPGITCGLSLNNVILEKEMPIHIVLDILCFMGSDLMLLCVYTEYKYEDSAENDIHTPFVVATNCSSKTRLVTLFAKCGFWSKMLFWWLNLLMKKGREKTLDDEDLPKLHEDLKAKSCYSLFMEKSNILKEINPSAQPSILKTILLCYWKEIFIAGFFALLHSLLLNAFIKFSEGKTSFEYEGYLSVVLLFFMKIIESISQRQWYFRMRLVGLKVRSLLTTAIYKKQLRLFNAAKPMHSNGEKIPICGEVGSGKSTLLAAVLGEVPIIQGTIQRSNAHSVTGKGKQEWYNKWLTSKIDREFHSTKNGHQYHGMAKRCSLAKDFGLLPYGDLAEIGERGVNLSGGQKQRVQLARALYQNADIYLLYDPFSAVDAHTATNLFNEYVVEALSGKSVLLVTHQIDFFSSFDTVSLTSDGEILHASSYSQLLSSSQKFRDLVNAHKEMAGFEKVFSKREKLQTSGLDQLIKQEEMEVRDTGFRPYILYLNHNKGFLIFFSAAFFHLMFLLGQILLNSWMAANVDDPNVSRLRLIVVYLLIGIVSTLFLLWKQSSKAIFSELLNSLFRAPMSFYDSTPLGRILNRVSSDLSLLDLDVPHILMVAVATTINFYSNLAVLAVANWQVLFVSIAMVFLVICIQRHYFQVSTAKALMRINGTTKSFLANHLAESVAGATIIRAFKMEDYFIAKNLELIDTNASPFFHNFALVRSSRTIPSIVLPPLAPISRQSNTGDIFMPLFWLLGYRRWRRLPCPRLVSNLIVSEERIHQCMDIPSKAPPVLEENHPPVNWPTKGKIKYRHDMPLVLHGICCTFEGHKTGIISRTGSGKTTLISALFRLVEPMARKIVVDGVDISTIGLHDLRSHFGIIPQDPTLFNGTLRYNLDPLAQHTEIKCQLKDIVEEKDKGLDSLGKLVEYDQPKKLMERENSLFGQLLKEYWSNHPSA